MLFKLGLLVNDAHEDLRFIRYTQATTKASVQLLASSNELVRSSIQVQIQQNMGFSLESDHSRITNTTALLVETAENIVNDDFQPLRRQGLVLLCSSFEHLVKCLIAEWLEYHPDKVLGLDDLLSKKENYLCKKFLQNPNPENLYFVADKLYKDIDSYFDHKDSYLNKIKGIISKHIPHQISLFESEVESVIPSDFNETFLVRNCLVHNGSQPNHYLSTQNSSFKKSERIILTKHMLNNYFKAVELVASGLYECSSIKAGLG